MVTGSGSYFKCEECGFSYKEQRLANECESWCREHHSCNLGITRHAVKQ